MLPRYTRDLPLYSQRLLLRPRAPRGDQHDAEEAVAADEAEERADAQQEAARREREEGREATPLPRGVRRERREDVALDPPHLDVAQPGVAQRTDAKKWQSEKSSSVRGPRMSAAGAAAARASSADDMELSVSTSLPSAIATSCAWTAGVARKRIAW